MSQILKIIWGQRRRLNDGVFHKRRLANGAGKRKSPVRSRTEKEALGGYLVTQNDQVLFQDDKKERGTIELKQGTGVAALIVTLISGAAVIIGMILCYNIEDSELILLMAGIAIAGGVGLIIGLGSLANQANMEEKNQRAIQLTQLANNLGVSEFCPTIGTVDSEFCIDTVHGLFAAEFIEDTIPKITVHFVSHIVDCSLEEMTQTVNNAKSRAIVGGVLAGTVGAIAGAASAKERQESIGYMLEITTDFSDFGTRYYSVSRDFGLQVVRYLKG